MTLKPELTLERTRQRIDAEFAPRPIFAERAPTAKDLRVGGFWFDTSGLKGYTKDDRDRIISWTISIV